MPNNSDGGIVLSVSIDSSEVSSDMKKVVSEINKQVQAEAKNIKAVESVSQAKAKTAQAQEKTEQEVYKTLQAESQALVAEQNLTTAKEKTATASAKTVQEEEKAYQAIAKTQVAEQQVQQAVNATALSEEKVTQAKTKTVQATTQSAITQQKLLQEIEKGYQAEEKTTQAELKTQQEQQKILLNDEKIKQAKEKTAQAEEKTRQAIIKTEKAQNSLKKATDSVANAVKKMASILGVAFSVKQLLNFSNEASELASQTEAYLSRLGTLYGEYGQDVYEWANQNANALGMAKSEAYEAAASFGNLFTVFADSQTSAKLSKEMLQATAVIASQTGRTYEETFEKIQSGLYGNTRAIDDLGISVRQASLKQTEAYQTVTQGVKSWNDLTDAELQQIRALSIVEQANAKYGNSVLRTSALTRSQFNAAWTDFKATWGQVVNTVLMPILQALTYILNAVTSLMTTILGFFGISFKVVNTQTEIGLAQQQQVDNQKDLNKELGKTNKQMADQLQSFDKINKLSDDTSGGSGSSGGGSSSGLGGGTGISSGASGYEITVDESKFDELKKKLEAIAVLVSTIGGSLLAWYAFSKISSDLPAFLQKLQLISGVALIIAGAILLIKGYSEAWVDGIDWENFSQIMLGLVGIISGIALAISPMAAAWVSVGGGIALVVLGIKDIISNGANLQNILTIIVGVATSIVGVLGAIGKISVVSTLIPLLFSLAGIVISLKGYFDSFINGLNWGNFITILGGLAVAVVGVKIAIGGMATSIALGLAGVVALIAGMNDFVKNGPNVQNTIMIIGGAVAVAVALATGGVSVLTSAIVALVATVGAFVVAIASEKGAILSTKEAQEQLNNAKEAAKEAEDNYINSVDSAEQSLKALKDAEKETGLSGEELYKQVQEGTLDYAKMTSAQKKVYKAYVDNDKKQKDLKKSTNELKKAKKKETLASFENQLALAKENDSYDEYKKSVIKAYEEGTLSAEEARDLIGKSMSEMSDDAQQTFMEDIPNDIKNGLDPAQYETKAKQLKDFAEITFSKISDAFGEAWKAIKKFWSDNIAPWFTKEKWESLIATIISGISSSSFVTKIEELWGGVKTYWNNNIAVWFTKEKWKGIFSKIIGVFDAKKVGETISNIGTTIKTFFNEKIKPWFTLSKWQNLASEAANGLKYGFKGGVNGIISFFEKMINSVVDGLNRISFTMPSWLPVVGGKHYGVSLNHVYIPRLAKGAVIPPNREFLAVLGDQKRGTNIEAPANLIKQMVKEGLSETQYSFGSQEIRVPVYLDSSVLFEAIVKSNEKNTKSTGVNVLAL